MYDQSSIATNGMISPYGGMFSMMSPASMMQRRYTISAASPSYWMQQPYTLPLQSVIPSGPTANIDPTVLSQQMNQLQLSTPASVCD